MGGKEGRARVRETRKRLIGEEMGGLKKGREGGKDCKGEGGKGGGETGGMEAKEAYV